MSDLLKETVFYKKVTNRIYDDGEPFCRHEVTEEEVNIITCKYCKYWNRKEGYCKHLSTKMGYLEDECYLVCTDADFFCADGKRKE